MSNFNNVCHRAAEQAMSQLHDDVQLPTSPQPVCKNEHVDSKFPSAAEVMARMCLNKILSPKDWSYILGLSHQSINRFRNGERILPEHCEKIFKIYLAVVDGMILQARDIRKNAQQVNDWVSEELKNIEQDFSK